ncbi:MAG: pitrilysin family protein [Patescibacteria group bacterium]|nr:pitrilysin family protein [Patescibacteria group bacterium]
MKSSELFERHALGNGIPVYIYRRYQDDSKKKGEEKSADEGKKQIEKEQDEPCWIYALLHRVGSWLDPPDALGTAHFREHIGYQGTVHCPSFEALAAVFDASGNWRDARTSQTYTEYGLHCKAECFLRLLPVFAEIITAPRIDALSTAHEREVIAAEYRESHILRGRVYLEEFLHALYGDHPLNHSPIGTPDSIQHMTPETLVEFQRRYYHASNLALFCCGTLPPSVQLLTHLETAFGTLTCAPAVEPIVLPPLPYGKEIELCGSDFRIDSINVNFPLSRPDARARVAWDKFCHYLGGDDANPVGNALREKHRLIYSAQRLARFEIQPHFCCLSFRLPVQRDHFTTALQVIREAAEELTTAKWSAYQNRNKRRHHSRSDKPLNPGTANERIKQALRLGEQPADALDEEITLEQLTWDEIDACRDQLLAIKPFIFRALA